MIMIHNSMVCLRVHYCVQLLPELVFCCIPCTFSFAKFFLLFEFEFLSCKMLRNAQFLKTYGALFNPN